ncbi:MAG: translocation/assembly module TamB domain-containing protein [Candidatus Coatesbacteria bacterium]|nr:MAG: translocation/assembly module TamB domain-containing protein [Candidatus Coatesbacteria bacterium]
MFRTVKKVAGAVWRGVKAALYFVLHLSKWTFLFIFLGVVSIVVIFWAFYSRGYFHELVEFAIEKYLGNFTQTQVRVDRVEGPLFTGIDIYGFAIGNGPSIEDDGCAVTVDEIHVKYNPLPFFVRDFTIDEVYLVHPQCMLRRDDDTGRLNLARIFGPKEEKKKGRGSYFTIEHVEMDDAFFIMFLNSPIYRFEDAHIETKFTKARGAVFLELGDCSVYLPHFDQWIPTFGNGDMAINARRIRMDMLEVETPTTTIITDGLIKMPKGGRTHLDLTFDADTIDLGEVDQGTFDDPLPTFGTGSYYGRLYGPTNDLTQEGVLNLPEGYLYGFDWENLSADYTFHISDRYLSVNEVSGTMDGMPVRFQMDMYFPDGGPPEYYGIAALSGADLGKYVRSGFLDSDINVFAEITGRGLSASEHDLYCFAEFEAGRIGPLIVDGGRADFRYSLGKIELHDVNFEMGDGGITILGEADAKTVDIAVNAVDVPLERIRTGDTASAPAGTFSFEGVIQGDNRYPSFDGGLLLKDFEYGPVRFDLARFDGVWEEYGRANEGELHAMFWGGALSGFELSAGRVDITVDEDRLTARRGRINVDETNYVDFKLDYLLNEKLLGINRLDVTYSGGTASLDGPLYLDMAGGRYSLTGGDLISGDSYLSFEGTYIPTGRKYEFEARAGEIRLGDVIPYREGLAVDGRLTELAVSGDGTMADPRLEGRIRVDDLAVNNEYFEYVDGTIHFTDGSFFVEKLAASTYDGELTVDGILPVSVLRGEGKDVVSLNIVFSDFDARMINAAVDTEVVDSGLIDGTVTITGTAGDMTAGGALVFNDLVRDDAEFARGRLDFAYADREFTIKEFSLSETTNANLVATGTIPFDLSVRDGGSPFGGEIELEFVLNDLGLALANLFTDEILVTGGTTDGRASIDGTFEKPNIHAEFTLTDGAGFVRTLRNNLSGLEGDVIWDETGLRFGSVAEPLNCALDEGSAVAYGRIYMNGMKAESIEVHAELDNYVIKALGGIQAKGDISVDVTGPASKPLIIAEVDVDNALIAIPFGGPSGGETYGAGEEAVDFVATITADRGVWLRNSSADIEFSVDMVVKRENGRTVYVGELEAVRGKYYFLQRRFEIEHAYVKFVGAEKMNPRLDILGSIIIRGERDETPDATVYIEIKGTLEEPELALRSPEYPGLTQDELMLMLALNVTWDDYQKMGGSDIASKETREYLEKYASNEVSRLLQRETGIDVFKIETTGLTGTGTETGVEATVGKYVTSDLYLTYTGRYSESEQYGTKEYAQAVGVEYRLHPGIYLYGETEQEEEERKYGIGLKFIHKY